MQIIDCYGTPSARGRIHGETLRTAITEALAAWEAATMKALGDRAPSDFDAYCMSFLEDAALMAHAARATPDLHAEVAGIAEGAKKRYAMTVVLLRRARAVGPGLRAGLRAAVAAGTTVAAVPAAALPLMHCFQLPVVWSSLVSCCPGRATPAWDRLAKSCRPLIRFCSIDTCPADCHRARAASQGHG